VGRTVSLDSLEEILPPPAIEKFLSCPACSLVTIPTELSWLLKLHTKLLFCVHESDYLWWYTAYLKKASSTRFDANCPHYLRYTPFSQPYTFALHHKTHTDMTFHSQYIVERCSFSTVQVLSKGKETKPFFLTCHPKYCGAWGFMIAHRIKHVLWQGWMIFISQSYVNKANYTAAITIIHVILYTSLHYWHADSSLRVRLVTRGVVKVFCKNHVWSCSKDRYNGI
jgi:hypothetical protein